MLFFRNNFSNENLFNSEKGHIMEHNQYLKPYIKYFRLVILRRINEKIKYLYFKKLTFLG